MPPRPRSARPLPTGTIFERAAIRRAIAELSGKDQRLALLLERFPPEPRERPRNLFANLCRTVCAQMLSNASARAIFGRLEGLCEAAITPEALAAVSDRKLRAAGLSQAKVVSLRALGEYFEADGNLFSRLKHASDEEVTEALTGIRGLGPWSAEMFLLFSLGRMDVYSARDAALATGLIKLKRLSAETPRPRLDAFAERYSPYRSVVSLALWGWRHRNWEKL
jgi:DNA-3-methyladenine glycosylase II